MNDKEKLLIKMVDRFRELINGSRVPETLEDDVFLACYEAGLMERNLLEIYLTFCDNRGIMELELHAAIMGYALGQAHGQYSIDNGDNGNLTH